MLLFFKLFVAVLSFLTSFDDSFPALFVRSSIGRSAASGAVFPGETQPRNPIGLGGARTHNQRLKRALLYH